MSGEFGSTTPATTCSIDCNGNDEAKRVDAELTAAFCSIVNCSAGGADAATANVVLLGTVAASEAAVEGGGGAAVAVAADEDIAAGAAVLVLVANDKADAV